MSLRQLLEEAYSGGESSTMKGAFLRQVKGDSEEFAERVRRLLVLFQDGQYVDQRLEESAMRDAVRDEQISIFNIPGECPCSTEITALMNAYYAQFGYVICKQKSPDEFWLKNSEGKRISCDAMTCPDDDGTWYLTANVYLLD